MLLNNWFSHIQKIHTQRMDFGLDRISVVADRLSLTQFNCPVITVAGTNGKGSCVKTLESIYQAAGYRTALYTSPHLMRFNERIRIHHYDVDDDALMQAFQVIETARRNTILSVFEFTTLSALWLFQQTSHDVIILEAGLGGRLDAVNIVENDIAVVTSIGLDHTDLLGDTREKIAYEKASIVRAGKLLICGDENPPVTLAQTVDDKQGILLQMKRDFDYAIGKEDWSCWGDCFHYTQLPLPILKPQNVATALAVISQLQDQLPVAIENMTRGIANTYWPARFERVYSPFPVILDVAHNPDASVWLAAQYQTQPSVKKTFGIVGMLKDKAMAETVSALLPCVDVWCVCNLQDVAVERGSDGSAIVEFLQTMGVKDCYTFDSVEKAMDTVLQAHCQGNCDRALIFGSFYTVASAKRWLQKGE